MKNATDHRVVITGLGPVTPIGVGRNDFCKAVAENRHGLGEITRFDPEPYGGFLSAEVRNFNVEDHLESQKAYLDPAAEFLLAAVSLAIGDADVSTEVLASERTGIAIGSAGGALETMAVYFEDLLVKGPRFVKPFLFQHTYSNTPIGLAAIEFGIRGCHLNFASGWLSSATALTAAWDEIRTGKADLMVAGGYEAMSEALYAGLMTTGGPTRAESVENYRGPFDVNGAGYVPGEGAVCFVLESEAHATGRGATILASLDACALGSLSGDALYLIWQDALRQAQATEHELGLLSLSANGDDAIETAEIDAMMQLAAGEHTLPAVTAGKSRWGEPLGCSTALQLAEAICIQTTGKLPTTQGLKTPRPAVAQLLERAAPEYRPQATFVSSVGPAGSAAAFVLRPHTTA